MAATPIVTNQLKKITTFVYILVLLYLANLISILKFQWDVIPIIVNVYLFVFSFYLIFNFSLIDIQPLKEEYRTLYPRMGGIFLFFKTRVFPFMIIYLAMVIYTLINYLDKGNWPWYPILELLDGRFTNTVFYSLILLLILKFNRRPRITLLLFVAGAALYFLIYQLVFYLSLSGAVMSGIKFFQIMIAVMLLVYEFLADKITIDRSKILKSVIGGAVIGVIMYSTFVGSHMLLFRFAPFASYQQTRSGQILLRLGYSFPLEKFKSLVTETSDPYLLYDYIYYSRAYDRPSMITPAEWENLILSGSMEVSNIIAFYLEILDVTVSYNQIISYAERRSIDSGEILLNSVYYTRYASRYCEENVRDMIERYRGGNKYYKIWIVRVIADSKNIAAVPFLVSLLTDIDPRLSQEAYAALARITGMDPARDLRDRINSPAVIMKFNEFYRDSSTKG
ncbi:MAG: HEAT repeat domain-containing protein [Spirochaetes bacterium]|nr:HEAT repeat domain-containing protein [Spirochaetota bacterium]